MPIIDKNTTYLLTEEQICLYRYNDEYDYREAIIIKFQGHIDIKVLEQTIQVMCQKHPWAFNGDIIIKDEQPFNTLSTDVDLNLHKLDWQPNLEESLILENFRQLSCSLKDSFQTRVYIYQKNEYTSYFSYSTHHIFTDGYSVSILKRDIVSIYNQLINNQQPVVNIKDNFTSYIVSVSQYRQTEPWKKYVAQTKEHWLNNNSLYPQERNYYELNEQVENSISSFVTKKIEVDCYQRFKAISKQAGIPISTIFLALYQISLHRAFCTPKLLVFPSLFNRSKSQMNTTGLFMKEMFIESCLLPEKTTFAQFINQTHVTLNQAKDINYPSNAGIMCDLIDDLGAYFFEFGFNYAKVMKLMGQYQELSTPLGKVEVNGIYLSPILSSDINCFILKESSKFIISLSIHTELYDEQQFDDLVKNMKSLIDLISVETLNNNC